MLAKTRNWIQPSNYSLIHNTLLGLEFVLEFDGHTPWAFRLSMFILQGFELNLF